MSASAQHRSHQLSALDVLMLLRVLATFAVVLGHCASAFGGFQFTQWPASPYMQNIAVTLFFCVSGFTIAWLLDRQQTTGWGGFGWFAFDRFCRLAIPLVPILIIFAIIEWFFYGSAHPYAENLSLRTAVGNVTFLQGLWIDLPFGWDIYPNVEPFGTNRPLWTISLEFWTYVAFGALYCTWNAGNRRSFGLVLVCGLALLLLGPSLYGGRGSGLPMIWALGAVGFHAMKHYRATTSTRLAATAAMVSILALMAKASTWPADGDYSANYNLLIYFLFMSIVAAASGLRVPLRAMERASFLGGFAYTTYLAHYPIVVMLASSQLLPPGSSTALVVTVLCYIASWALSLPFESNYRKVREGIRARISAVAFSVKGWAP